MNNSSSESVPPADPQFPPAPASVTPPPGHWHPNSEVDFTLDDLLISSETDAALSLNDYGEPLDFAEIEAGDASDLQRPEESSIFADELLSTDAGSDFLHDYTPPVNSSNIFDDGLHNSSSDLLAETSDDSGVDFNPSPSQLSAWGEDSLSGNDLEQWSQKSNDLLEQLDQPFPEQHDSVADWSSSTATLLDDAIDESDWPSEEVTDQVSFDLPGLVPASEVGLGQHVAQDWTGSPTEAITVKPVPWTAPAHNSARTAPDFDFASGAETVPARRMMRWLAPVGGVAVGASLTAAAFLLLSSSPPPPQSIETAVVEPAPVAPALVPPTNAAEELSKTALAEAREQLLAERERSQLVLKQLRQDTERTITAEQERARTLARAARAAEATQTDLARALESIQREAARLRTTQSQESYAAEERLTAAKAELAKSQGAVTEAQKSLASARQVQRRLEAQLAEQKAALLALSKPTEPVAPLPQPKPESVARMSQAEVEALLATGIERYSAGQLVQAEQILAEAAGQGGDARAWYFLGFARYRLGQDPQAAFSRGAELERQGRPRSREVNELLEGVDRAARQALATIR